MKKYILTIEYKGNTDEIESITEELIEPDTNPTICEDDIAKLTTQGLLEIMFHKEYGKA